MPSVFSHAVASIGISACFYRRGVLNECGLLERSVPSFLILTLLDSASAFITAISGGTADLPTLSPSLLFSPEPR